MPKKETVEEPKAELKTHLVLINGVDHSILATDEQDLQEKISKLRSPSAI
jgi:hypothetical protein